MTSPNPVLDAMRAAQLASERFTAGDGHPSIRMRTNEEAADLAAEVAHRLIEEAVQEAIGENDSWWFTHVAQGVDAAEHAALRAECDTLKAERDAAVRAAYEQGQADLRTELLAITAAARSRSIARRQDTPQ